MQLTEPPTARATSTAFSIACAVRTLRARRPSATISTIRPPAAAARSRMLLRVRPHRRRARHRHAQRLGQHMHGVRRSQPRADARPVDRRVGELAELLHGHLAGLDRAHRFVDGVDVDRAAGVGAAALVAADHQDRREVQPALPPSGAPGVVLSQEDRQTIPSSTAPSTDASMSLTSRSRDGMR